jgi:hypothetical protein
MQAFANFRESEWNLGMAGVSMELFHARNRANIATRLSYWNHAPPSPPSFGYDPDVPGFCLGADSAARQ